MKDIREMFISAALSENLSLGFLTRFETDRAVTPQEMARGLKFCIYVVTGLNYLCSGTNCSDQLPDLICTFIFVIDKQQIFYDAAYKLFILNVQNHTS